MNSFEKTRQFLHYYSLNQRRIYGFIRSQVRSAADADDLLQETSVLLWEKFSDFDPSRDFVRWACGFARFKVLEHYRREGRAFPLLDADGADRYAQQLLELLEEEDIRTAALAECLEELTDRQQHLIRQRYGAEAEIRTIAQRLNRSESAVYKSLTKIHELLFHCIERRIAREGA